MDELNLDQAPQDINKEEFQLDRVRLQAFAAATGTGCKRTHEVDDGRFQRHDGSGRPRATADREDRLTVISAVTAPDSSLSSIRHETRIGVSTITIHKRPIERNLSSYRLLRHLPLPPVQCQAILGWCLTRSSWNPADWGRILLPTVSCRPSKTCLERAYCTPHRPLTRGVVSFDNLTLLVVIREYKTQPYVARVAMNCFTACQTLPWPARSLSNRVGLGYDGKTTADDLGRQLEQHLARNTAVNHQNTLSLCATACGNLQSR
ncbi:HTH_Tnp_Tc3_2 domain-containing protein [Trichonephila clavipes]|nr:HTH_Tnp_Tc3_2 domain-containing protein [Trichonephila clavipes]